MMHQLDAKRLLCPLPVIRLQNMVNRLTEGETIEIVCTDPGTQHDIPAWCRIHGHVVLEHEEKDALFRFIVKVGASK